MTRHRSRDCHVSTHQVIGLVFGLDPVRDSDGAHDSSFCDEIGDFARERGLVARDAWAQKCQVRPRDSDRGIIGRARIAALALS